MRKRCGRCPAWLAVAGLILALVAPGCAPPDSFDSRLRDIVGTSAFSIAGWEFQALLHETGQVASSIAGDAVDEITTVVDYFAAGRRLAAQDE